jgi:hypothetical protein
MGIAVFASVAIISPLSAWGSETPPQLAVGVGTYENDSPQVSLRGPWVTTPSANDSGGSGSTLSGAGDAEFSFRSSGIRWITRMHAWAGIADVYLDGVKRQSIDLYSAKTRYREVVYQASGLADANHTIRIAYTHTNNPASGGSNVTLDAFSVPDLVPPSAPTSVTATPERTGVRITWNPSPDADIAEYRVYRRTGETEQKTLVQSVSATTSSVHDVGLEGGTYLYDVVAIDTSGNTSPPGAASVTTPSATIDTPRRFANCPAATVTVTDRATLVAALSGATAGSVVRLSPGRYSGRYDISASGTESTPVWICGPRTAIVDNGMIESGYGFRVTDSAHVVIAGMTVRNGQKGIAVVNSTNVTVADTRVEDIGDEAIHLRSNTTRSTVIGNSIARTGLVTPAYGEGIYVGSSGANWCTYSNCQPDRSDHNTVAFNTISDTTAEQIEAKEGTSGGVIAHNTLDGAGMVRSAAESLIAIQGTRWVTAHNNGRNAPRDGVRVSQFVPGWGTDNILYANTFGGAIPGFGVLVAPRALNTIVGCDTAMPANALGISNQDCQN